MVDTRVRWLTAVADPALHLVRGTCPVCSARGAAVQVQTVKALLTDVALSRVQQTHYRFCSGAACDVVYFGDAGDRFGMSNIRVPVWHTQPPGRGSCATASEKAKP
jgi:hypothetical protein